MRSPLGALLRTRPTNQAPVPYASRGQTRSQWWRPGGADAQMRAMGHVGTLFAIVDRLATSTAAVKWGMYREAKPDERPEDRTRVTSHAALDLWRKPNPFFTQQLLVETVQQHYELVGEGWLVVSRNPSFRSIPLELWPVSPSRMTPIPDRDDYLVGYMYSSPDGEQVPLALDEVIQIRRPNPIDPYRGIGAVQTILADLEGVQLSAEWNRNFFRNSAEPGGIIQVPERLQDEEFNELRDRWNEQHKGVANAHRVAILEHGEWVDRKITQRDMQFVELRSVSREVIREAFGITKFAIGDVEDINRATGEAAKTWFAEQMTEPRAERWKQALNGQLLPMFGTTSRGNEFDFESPVPEDQEAQDKQLTAKANAAAALAKAGWDGADVLETVGLPPMRFVPPPMLHLAPPAPPAPEPAAAARLDIHHHPAAVVEQPAGRPPRAITAAADEDPDDLPDVSPVLEALDAQLEELMAEWPDITQAQKTELINQIKHIAESGAVADLAGVTVTTTAASAALAAAMTTLAATAGEQVVAEAAAQGVTLEAVTVAAEALEPVADVVAGLLAEELKTSAVRAALAANGPEVDAETITTAVTERLDGLSDASARRQLGGALHGSMNAARIETLRAGPVGAVYASEKNDRNTCRPCRAVNGTWLGNTDELAQIERSYPAGAFGGYVLCEGGVQCRGTVTGVWRPQQVSGS